MSRGEKKPSMSNESGAGGGEDGADKGDLLHTWEDGFDI